MHTIASPIERLSSVRDILRKETLLPELLESVMASAGFGLILATADRGIVYANVSADTLMRARNRLRCERRSQGLCLFKKITIAYSFRFAPDRCIGARRHAHYA